MPVTPLMTASVGPRVSVGRSYLRGHAIDVALIGAAATWALIAATPQLVSVPSLRAVAPLHVRLALLLLTVVTILVCAVTREPVPAISVTSPRGHAPARFARIVAVTIGALLLGLALVGDPYVIAPRFLFLTAIGLTGVRLLGGRAAWLAPTSYVVTCVLVGTDRDGTFDSWAWILDDTSTAGITILSVAAFLAASLWWSRQPPERDLW
jgi:hypothetical protein